MARTKKPASTRRRQQSARAGKLRFLSHPAVGIAAGVGTGMAIGYAGHAQLRRNEAHLQEIKKQLRAIGLSNFQINKTMTALRLDAPDVKPKPKWDL